MNEERELRLEDINFLGLFKDLIRNCWIVILAAVSMLMLVSVYIKIVYTPEYTSQATLVISAKGAYGAYSALSMTNEMAGVFAEVFQSQVLRDTVSKELGDEPVTERITTMVIPETNLLRVSVTAESPKRAFEVLDAVMKNYSDVSDYLFSNAVLDVIKEPTVPMGPSNGFPGRKYKMLALMAGFMMSAGGIVVLSVLRDSVKTVSAAKHNLDGRMLGVICHEKKNKTWKARLKRKNTAALISNALVSFSYMEAYQSLCAKLDYHMRKRDQKVLLVSSACENEGKSTVAANLAIALASRNKKVLLVDCDLKKPAMHKIFEVDSDPENSFGNFLRSDSIKTVGLYNHKKRGLYLALNRSGCRNSQQLVTSEKLRKFLSRVKERMDYVILDSPPMLITSDAEALASLADASVLVIRQDHGMTGDLNDCIDMLRQVTPDFVGYVLNDFQDFGTVRDKKQYHKNMDHQIY